jgi:hypothetical protein
MEQVTDSIGRKGFYDEMAGFIPVDDMQKVTDPQGKKGYFHEKTGFVPIDITQNNIKTQPQPTSFLEHPIDYISQHLPSKQTISNIVRPTLEGLGTGGGAILGSSVGPLGTVAGGTLGYMGGSQLADVMDQTIGLQKPRSLMEEAQKQAEAAKTGALYTMGGEVAGPLLKSGLNIGGKVYSNLAGFLTGKGAINIEQVFKKGFDRNIDATDIFNLVKEGLQNVKEMRGANYRTQLQSLKQANQPIDINPIGNKFDELLIDYNLQTTGSGKIIPKGVSKLYKSELNNINEIASDVRKIANTPEMQTPEQLDLFKQKLDNFWSKNRDSRAFVSSLRNTVKNLISKNIPEYDAMMADYTKSSDFIKEIEKSLTGKMDRSSINSTLSKLTRAMKEEPDYRRELLEKLSGKTGQDLQSEIASYSMKPWMPEGRVGHLGGLAALYELIATHNPKFAGLMAITSPRIQAEFLSILGQGYKAIAPTISKMPVTPYGPVITPQLKELVSPSKGE